MYPVFLNSREEGSFEDLLENLISICNSHKSQKGALAFAFILYDFTNESIREVLQQKTKWDALSEISGKHLTIFSIHSLRRKRIRARSSISDKPLMQWMTSYSSFDKPDESERLLIDKYFDGEISFPSVLFFQVDNDEVIDSILFELRELGSEGIYLELKDYIAAAVKALVKIQNDSSNHPKDIFRELTGNVKQVNFKRTVKRSSNNIIPIAKFISLFKGFA